MDEEAESKGCTGSVLIRRIGNKKDWISSATWRNLKSMKGVGKYSLAMIVALTLCVDATGQDAPKKDENGAPAKESNGTTATTDQNKTAPAKDANKTAPAGDAIEKPVEEEKTADDAVPSPEKKLPDIPRHGNVDFNEFIRSNPFGLAVEKKAPPKPRTVVQPRKPAVRLTGMSVIGGKKRVGLAIKVPGASKWINQRLGEGDNPNVESKANGVKIIKIDAERGEVTVQFEVDNTQQTFAFDEDEGGRTSQSSSRNSRGTRRNVRPSATTTKPSKPENTTRPLPSSGDKKKGSKLVPLPKRRGSSLDLPRPTIQIHGQPVFDEKAQTKYIVASQIGTQREFPLGVRAAEPPIDLPAVKR